MKFTEIIKTNRGRDGVLGLEVVGDHLRDVLEAVALDHVHALHQLHHKVFDLKI